MLNLFAFLTGVIMIFVMANIIVSVITRYFFNRPLIWVTEIDEYLMVYVTFLGTAWLLRDNGHVRVDIIYNFIGKKARFFLELLHSAIGIIVSLVFIVNGSFMTLDHFKKGIYNPTILEIPMWIVLIIIPLGGLFLLCQFIRDAYKLIRYSIEKGQ